MDHPVDRNLVPLHRGLLGQSPLEAQSTFLKMLWRYGIDFCYCSEDIIKTIIFPWRYDQDIWLLWRYYTFYNIALKIWSTNPILLWHHNLPFWYCSEDEYFTTHGNLLNPWWMLTKPIMEENEISSHYWTYWFTLQLWRIWHNLFKTKKTQEKTLFDIYHCKQIIL